MQLSYIHEYCTRPPQLTIFLRLSTGGAGVAPATERAAPALQHCF